MKNLDIKLSQTQSNIIEEFRKNPRPTMILGGAGTGKTVLAVHFLSDFSSDGQSAYFTQSRELLNSVEHKYKNIDGHKENVDPQFLNINEFCRSVLEDGAWARKNFVETTQFLNEFVANDND